jgi:hypothetical protein
MKRIFFFYNVVAGKVMNGLLRIHTFAAAFLISFSGITRSGLFAKYYLCGVPAVRACEVT